MTHTSIIIFSEDFPPKDGGIAQWAAGIAKSLHRMSYTVKVLTRHISTEAEKIQLQESYPVIQVYGNRWRQLRSYYTFRAMKALYNREKAPDVVIATTWNIARGITGLLKKHGTKLIVVIHGLEVTRKMNWMKRVWLIKTLKSAHRVIAVSNFTQERVISQYNIPPDNIITLPNGVDPERFHPLADVSILQKRFGLVDKKIILTLARLQERKGHDKVIEALPMVMKQVPNAHYLISGAKNGAFYKKISQQVKDMGLESHVTFTGYVEPEEINLFYNLCDVYIMPSRELKKNGDTEGFGITFLEANACEKPVIGGRSGGVVDAIENGITGYLVDPLDVEEIAQKLTLLLTNDQHAHLLGQQGRQRILKNYTWDAVASRIVDALSL
jgi:phosphatidyl-myo-inositol dimannoside synthase